MFEFLFVIDWLFEVIEVFEIGLVVLLGFDDVFSLGVEELLIEVILFGCVLLDIVGVLL